MNLIASTNKMFRLLFFRISRDEMLKFNYSDIIVGFVFTWIVGIGRYWDDPGAKLLQHLGVGSLIYICILSYLIWCVLRPFYIKNWSFKNVLTFVSFTSAPAILYAIPVERFFDIDTSATINAYFLLVVAVWRVLLLIFYLKIFACISPFQIAVTTLLPLTAIVTSLTFLNLERAIFNIMGGIREHSSNDIAYHIVIFLTVISMILIGPVIIAYLTIIFLKYRARKSEKELKS